jgi:pilus assembly protein CpaE
MSIARRIVCFRTELEQPQAAGVKVIASATDVEALGECDISDCDAVLIDLDETDTRDLGEIKYLLKDSILVGVVSPNTPAVTALRAQRLGCNQLITKPIDPDELSMVLAADSDESVGKIISVIGACGGAGATTIACNLAVELSAFGETLLVDGDLTFGGVARYFDLNPRHTMAELCASEDSIDATAVKAAVVETAAGPFVLARPSNITERGEVTTDKMISVLTHASRSYNYVIIDLPRQLDDITGNIILQSNHLIIVSELTVASLLNAKRIKTALVQEGIPEQRLAFVLNRVRKNAHSLDVSDATEQLGSIFAEVPNDFTDARSAIDQGSPIDPSSPVRGALRQLAHKLSGREDAPKTAKKGGLMRLLGRG